MTAPAPTSVVEPRRSVARHLAELWEYRELLANLVRKELKVRYKNSALGFAWSLLNPAMLMVVYTIVFQVVLNAGIPYFPIYLLSGLLAWNLFSASLAGGANSITGNHSLVNKVYFPREILPLANVGAASVHFCLQASVLLLTIAISPVEFDLRWLWMVLPAMAVLLLMGCTFAIFLAALNVYARDTQHLLELALLAWIWLTPVIYAWHLPASKLEERGISSGWLLLNPMVSVVTTMQRSLYGFHTTAESAGLPGRETTGGTPVLPLEGQWWFLRNLGVTALVFSVLFVVALRWFNRVEGNFAEEL